MFFSLKVDFSAIVRNGGLRLVERSNDDFLSVADQKNAIAVSIKRRQAYPATFLRKTAFGYQIGYDQYPEFLKVDINETTGDITIERDAYMVLPVFYGWSNHTLVVSNDYGEVVKQIASCSLSYPTFFSALNPMMPPLQSTLLREVRILTEREKLFCTANGPRLLQPQSRPWTESRFAPESSPEDFLNFFNSHLDSFVQTRLRGQNVAFEVSGGLDSTTLPLYMAARSGRIDGVLSGVLFPGDFGISQLQKLQKIGDRTKGYLQVEIMDPVRHVPLSRHLGGSTSAPFHYRENPYHDVFSRHLARLKDYGVTVIATGKGGDDICENVVDEQQHFMWGQRERDDRYVRELPPYLTDVFRREYAHTTPPKRLHAIPLQAISSVGSMSDNNLYIEHDIWPVSPFLDPVLHEFTQGLPAHFRMNKNILRAYHQAHQFIPEIYTCLDSEHFGYFFKDAMMQPEMRQALVLHGENALSIREGYVDFQRLLETYDQASHSGDSRWLYHLFNWLAAEMTISRSFL